VLRGTLQYLLLNKISMVDTNSQKGGRMWSPHKSFSLRKDRLINIQMHKDSVRTSQRKQHAPIMKKNWLMLYGKLFFERDTWNT